MVLLLVLLLFFLGFFFFFFSFLSLFCFVAESVGLRSLTTNVPIFSSIFFVALFFVVTHKFFTTDLPFGLVIYKDIAIELGVDVPIIDELIRWNQKMVGKEFMLEDGTLNGKDVAEGVYPSKYGGIAAAVAAAAGTAQSEKK